MKALTVNRMAAARLRANRKAYISLIVGIFLSVFLVTTLVLCIQGVILAQMEQTDRRLGFEDAFLLDTPELTDGDLAGMGYFDAIGHVYVTAGIQDTDICLGWYDETGVALLSRQTLEGRLPEKAGEIAMERSAMLAIRGEGQWQLGDEVTLKVIPVDEDTKSLYKSCTRRDAVVTIGGVLDSGSDFLGGSWGAVLTTEEGLRNMGLFRNGWDVITIYLDGIVDEDAEGSLTQSVTAIARRAEGSRVYNYMESARENARTQLQLMLLMGAITIVFFAVAAGMIVSAVTRQLQADGKRIGMLRAVGAEEKTILRCYSGQVFLSLGLGMVSSILVMAVLFTSSIMNVPARYYPSGIATILVFSLACLGLCQFMLRRRVRQITKQSIIDNIREL